ncbi:N-acetyltransferase [Lentzea sp. NBRC 105346]|uniref:GNAT family N-acetyltransferase n=1 Tax=Lentzea sp. NBRC 105346 TaxID=3032205 RepID=UPI0024A13631|nr:GNAT family N-acetyltransferase [Lentzea sp. NBRC 105346]GLZ35631.1 N-acetyltransferase [Lentzea sp. NBRC 105346]
MDDIDRLEHLCARAWPALAQERLGDWLMRAAQGFTGRANSTLTTGDPGLTVPNALAATVEFAARNDIAPTAHVVIGSRHERAIAAAGWRVNLDHPGGAESLVMTGPLAPFAGIPAESRETPGWWELAAAKEPTEAQKHVLATGDVCFASIEENGETVAAVRGTVVEHLLHVARLNVRPEHRRRGLARELMARLAGWGVENGATTCVLQVAEHNKAAIELYTSLGCEEHHRYRYWIPA